MMIRVAVLIVGDKKTADIDFLNNDVFGDVMKSIEGKKDYKKVVSEDFRTLQEELFNITERGLVDLILTIGGTGFARKDVAPEATMAVIEKETPGIAEFIRQETGKKHPGVALSRGRAGIRKSTLIINLPDEEKEINESLKVLPKIIPEGIKILQNEYSDHKYNELRLW